MTAQYPGRSEMLLFQQPGIFAVKKRFFQDIRGAEADRGMGLPIRKSGSLDWGADDCGGN